ncbi:MAG: amidophosphoribosyltransferase [Deltaproteobacteria bacterium]|nr:amidophosphoribosyltransferase [Deltaproteobacteria bacterium]
MATTLDRPREACGIFGIYGNPEAVKMTYFGLYALQHRGQESAGIAVVGEEGIRVHKGMGLVSEVFDKGRLKKLQGNTTIGHVRYSTTGDSTLTNAQPFVINHRGKSYAVAHNGNLVNAYELRNELEKKGAIFQSTMDSEILLHLLMRNLDDGLEEGIKKSVAKLRGAFSIVILTEDSIIGIKDPNGFRPLCIGRLNGSYVLASESCALDLVEAEYVRAVDPGEIVIINKDGLKSIKNPNKAQTSLCIFEFIYFARPDSNIYGLNVYEMRKAQGKRLADEFAVEADLVMPFPDSGNYSAIGFAGRSGIPFEMGMIRNHYVGRTFIQPTQTMREFGVRVKLNPVKSLLKGKRIIIIEDSIIRGTTARNRVRALREIGVKEVHMRVSCPPHRFPCHYGIDFSSRGELVAASKSVEEIRDFLGLDTLHYLSLDGLLKATGTENPEEHFCKACFDGKYPVAFDESVCSKTCFERSS